MAESVVSEPADHLVQELARLAQARGLTVATAESLTGGQLAVAISACDDSSEWYRGGIVAYQPATKHGLLAAPPGPVVTAPTAAAMARSAVQLLEADYAVALTGVGGPGPEEGQPAGTVYLATCAAGEEPDVVHRKFEGNPMEVLEGSVLAALQELVDRITRG